MKKLRWQILVVVLTLIVVAVLLITQQPGLNPILPKPASGGIYTEALIGSFGRLNPMLDLNNLADRSIDRLLFGSLVKFDPSGIPVPDLAESWGVSADGTIYNVTLRSNAFWHDDVPVTSSDILFTINLIRNPTSIFPQDVRTLWDQVEVTQMDDKNLKFKLPEPYVPFLDYLTFGILPSHILAAIPPEQLASSEFNLAPVGSGPFKFDHVTVDNGTITSVVLEANQNYFTTPPFLEQVVFRFYPNEISAINAYNQGEVLGISQISADLVQTTCSSPTLSCYSSREPQLTLVLFNLDPNGLSFFQEKAVRRALLKGLNRQAMVNNILSGQAVVADSPILPQTWAYYDGTEHITFNQDEAIQDLKVAGYTLPSDGIVRKKEDVALSFTLIHPDDPVHTQVAQAIQTNWSAMGVEVTLQPVPYETLMKDYLVPRKYQAALIDLDLSRTYDPDPYPFWHQAEITSGQNYSQWDNRTASEFLEQARVVADPNIRARLYRNFQVIFTREMPALPLYYPIATFGVDQRIQGVQAYPLFDLADRLNDIDQWYLVTKRSFEETQVPSKEP